MLESKQIITEEKVGKVYKITSPSGKVYVGSTKRPIEKRWWAYKSLKCYEQPKLLRSLKKYGSENHIYEVIWQGSIKDMLRMERILGDELKVLNPEKGLTLKLPGYDDVPIVFSEEVKKRMSEQRSGSKHHNYGKKATSEQSKVFSECRKGEKNHRYGKFGESNSLSTKINQYTTKGIFIKTFNSYSDVFNNLGISRNGLKYCIDNNHFIYKNFIWTVNNTNIGDLDINQLPIKIDKLDLSGNYVTTYDNIELIIPDLGCSTEQGCKYIRGCLKGLYDRYKDFSWRYNNPKFNENKILKENRKGVRPKQSEESIRKRSEKLEIPVDMFTKNWEYVNSFKSLVQATNFIKGSSGEVSKSCKDGKTTVKGFRFKYAEKYLPSQPDNTN